MLLLLCLSFFNFFPSLYFLYCSFFSLPFFLSFSLHLLPLILFFSYFYFLTYPILFRNYLPSCGQLIVVHHKLHHTESFTKYAMSSAYLWCSFEEPLSLQKFLSALNLRERRARTCWQMWPVHIPLSDQSITFTWCHASKLGLSSGLGAVFALL